MKKILSVSALALGGVLLAVAGLLLWVRFGLPRVPLTGDPVASTPALVARGAYLGRHVAVCLDCHSARDWTRNSGPMVPGTEGAGGETFTPAMGMPGTFVAPNITPHRLAAWSDAELRRAITAGVSKDGTPLFPLMPWPAFGRMDARDVDALIAWVRTLAPKTNEPPRSAPMPVMALLMRTMPKPASPETRPAADAPTSELGRTLAGAASCIECHTPAERGQINPDLAYAGGRAFPLPGGGTARSANLTPDPTGLGGWTREAFIRRFKSATNAAPVTRGQANTVMPWTMYAGMTEEDLGAIYDYLRTVKPLPNRVTTFTPPES